MLKIQRPIRFKNECGVIVNESLLERAMIWYALKKFGKPICSIKPITMQDRYPSVKIQEERARIHRIIGCYLKQRILRRDEHVHHKDANVLNALASNLKVMDGRKHLRLAQIGRKQSPELIIRRTVASMHSKFPSRIFTAKMVCLS